MAIKTIGALNGANLTRDFHLQSGITAIIAAGVVRNFDTELEVQTNLVKAGLCFVTALRTSVSPNETFLVPVRLHTDETISTAGTGFIIVKLDPAKVNDNSGGATDGQGVATIENVSSLPSNNFLTLATLASGVITDARAFSTILNDALEDVVDGIPNAALKTDSVTAAKILDGEVAPEKLENGVAVPGVNKFYGTDGAGVAGFFSFPEGSVSVDLDLGEAMTNGDPVSVDFDGRARLSFDFTGEISGAIETGAVTLIRVAYLTDSKVAMVYTRGSQTRSVVYDINTDGTITFGTEVTISTSAPTHIVIDRVSDTKYMVVFRSAANGVQVVHCDVSGTTITVNTIVTIDGTGDGQLSLAMEDTSIGAVAFRDSSLNLLMVKITISGASVTVSATTNIEVAASTGVDPKLSNDPDNSGGVITWGIGLGTTTAINGYTISGATVAIGTEILVSTNLNIADVQFIRDGIFVTKTQDTNEIRTWLKAGTTVTAGAQVSADVMSEDGDIFIIDGKYIASIVIDGTDMKFQAIEFSMPTDEDSFIVVEEFTNVTSETGKSEAGFDVRGNRFAIGGTNSSGSAGTAFVKDWNITIAGILQATGVKDDTVAVMLAGEDDAQSGLTPGVQQFVEEGGVISSSSKFGNRAIVGIASEATKVLINSKNVDAN